MQKLLLLSVILLVISCGKVSPTFEGIDLSQWKEDKFGCKGVRLAARDQFVQQQEKLKGLTEAEIIALLGRPDHNELYKRNQKFYHYFIASQEKCPETKSATLKMTLRFNAMGRAKEVAFE